MYLLNTGIHNVDKKETTGMFPPKNIGLCRVISSATTKASQHSQVNKVCIVQQTLLLSASATTMKTAWAFGMIRTRSHSCKTACKTAAKFRTNLHLFAALRRE